MRKTLFILTVFILFVAFSWPYLTRSSKFLEKLLDPQTYYQREAYIAYRSEQFSRSIRLYKMALSSKNLFFFSMKPLNRAAVKLQIARAYLKLKNYSSAKKYAISAISDAPNWFPPYLLSLQIIAESKELSQLNRLQKQILKKFHSRWQSYVALGNLYRAIEQLRPAIKFYREAVRRLESVQKISSLPPEQRRLLSSLKEVLHHLSEPAEQRSGYISRSSKISSEDSGNKVETVFKNSEKSVSYENRSKISTQYPSPTTVPFHHPVASSEYMIKQMPSTLPNSVLSNSRPSTFSRSKNRATSTTMPLSLNGRNSLSKGSNVPALRSRIKSKVRVEDFDSDLKNLSLRKLLFRSGRRRRSRLLRFYFPSTKKGSNSSSP